MESAAIRGKGLPMCLAVPGKLLTKETVAGVQLGQVQFGGITRQVALGFVPEAEVGDYVLVHVGFAISRVDAAEAQRTYEILEQLGALEEELAGEESIPGQPS
jgi:hydrogenase expression/formation protein HypC